MKYPDLYEKDKTKYWNGYTNQEAVLFDDVELADTYLLGPFKKYCQEKPFMAEDKYGGLRPVRPKTIIITSNFRIDDIWTAEVDRQALKRRFTVTHIVFPIIF